LVPFVLALLALDMGGAARDLARGVATAVAHEQAAIAVRNLSSLGPSETAEIRRQFEFELKAGQPATPAANVQITISENLTEYLLVAEIQHGGERQVFLESWPRTASASTATKGAGRVTLEKKLLWEQDQPILDAAQTGDTILVLDAARVLLVRGSERQSAPISTAHAWPRDLRGRLSVGGAAFTAWLPGTVCRGALQPRLTIECHDSQDPWLLAPGALATFTSTANFFRGHIDVEPGGVHELPPFYAAAPAGDAWVFAGTDGRARVYSNTWELVGEAAEWGSDLAAIETPCGPRVLVNRASANLSEPDSIQPYAIAGGEAHPSGGALEFTGPITALWAAGNSATAVSHDLQTGRYAAYSLAPACGA
jgi:hypothetical protein